MQPAIAPRGSSWADQQSTRGAASSFRTCFGSSAPQEGQASEFRCRHGSSKSSASSHPPSCTWWDCLENPLDELLQDLAEKQTYGMERSGHRGSSSSISLRQHGRAATAPYLPSIFVSYPFLHSRHALHSVWEAFNRAIGEEESLLFMMILSLQLIMQTTGLQAPIHSYA